jgi:hypothetical protein
MENFNTKDKIINLLDKLSNSQISDKYSRIKSHLNIENSVKSNSIKNTSSRNRFSARNFQLEYKNCETSDIRSLVEKTFLGDSVTYFNDGNNSIATIQCTKKKKLEFNLKPLIVNRRKPIVRTFGYLFQNSKSYKIENTDDNVLLDLFESMLKTPESTDLNKLKKLIAHEMDKSKILIINEYFLIDSNLVVFELKFRNQRRNTQVRNAFIILKKKYIPRILKWMSLKQPKILEKLTYVNSVGMGFSLFKRKVNLGILYKKEKI